MLRSGVSLMAGTVIKELKGAGKVIDYRGTGLLKPSGGIIQPLIMVEHIPLMKNVPGTDDFLTLARVLNDRGLSLQAATDRGGQRRPLQPAQPTVLPGQGRQPGQLRRRAHAQLGR